MHLFNKKLNTYLQFILNTWKFHSYGKIRNAKTGNIMEAKENIIPINIIIRGLCSVPWNSVKYDISTANGPHILDMIKRIDFNKTVIEKCNI